LRGFKEGRRLGKETHRRQEDEWDLGMDEWEEEGTRRRGRGGGI
jgi:hypothetical protein